MFSSSHAKNAIDPIPMEQDERAVLDPSEGSTEQGDEATAPSATLPVLADEGVSEVDRSGRGAGSENAKEQVVEEPQPELDLDEVANEDREALENPVAIATHFEFRAAAADATPPSASLRARSMRFTASGDAEKAGSEAVVLGASPSSAPATGTHHHGLPAMANVDQGAVPEDDKKMKRAWSAPGARVAIAHASPPDSYRHVPWRSRKQYSPKRFPAAVAASPSAAALPAGDPPARAASPGPTLPSASASGLRTGITDASASSSSSNRPPSRGRKQPRPEYFIPVEAEATASAKARRSDIVLDRFLSSLAHGSSASECVSNVTAEDAAVLGQHQSTVEEFRIRDASRHAARASRLRAALSRLGASCGGSCSSASAAAPGSSPGESDGRGRFYGVLAVLGASLALSVVSCVLFYIVGKRSDAGSSRENPDELAIPSVEDSAKAFSQQRI